MIVTVAEPRAIARSSQLRAIALVSPAFDEQWSLGQGTLDFPLLR
jgi:hypothetical protein